MTYPRCLLGVRECNEAALREATSLERHPSTRGEAFSSRAVASRFQRSLTIMVPIIETTFTTRCIDITSCGKQALKGWGR
jgi:hypothetical protein